MLRVHLYHELLFVLMLLSTPNLALAQRGALVSGGSTVVPAVDRILSGVEPPAGPLLPAAILAQFIATETRLREELNQHTFKRDVTLQTIGPNGKVTGQYIRNSAFLFDDRGNRIERVLYRPPSTITEMRITKEDIQDLAGAQLLGLDVFEAGRYHLKFTGREYIDSREAYIIEVTPKEEPDPHRMKDRFFIGRLWIDTVNSQIIKLKGVVEPQGKQRFPVFETWRVAVVNSFAFPSSTEADQVLYFPKRAVHYRIKVRYYDYKRFSSRVSVTEVDRPTDN